MEDEKGKRTLIISANTIKAITPRGPSAGKCKQSILVYGITATGKTTQLEEIARWIRDTEGGKHLRLVSCSGGGWSVIQPAVDAGLIKPIWIKNRKYAMQVLDRVTKGWWPEVPDDPNSKLIPPERQPDWDQVGGVAFDDLTAAAGWVMTEGLAFEAESDGRFRMTQDKTSIIYKEGEIGDETSFCPPARGHFLTVQNAAAAWVSQSKDLKDKYVVWTALEAKGVDQVDERTSIYGPEVSGQKLTGKVPSWFDRTVRLTIISQSPNPPVRRMYLRNHFELPDPVPYLANVRDYWKQPLPEFLQGPVRLQPNEKTDVSLYKLYELLILSYSKAQEFLQREKKT